MDAELYIERIEQYESGTMSAADRSAFESELASNAALRQAHALYLQANDVVEQGVENQLRTQLRQWSAETGQSPLSVTKPGRLVAMSSTWVRMAVAASVALLIGWFGWQWAGSQYSDEALYAGYYDKPADSAFRAGASTENDLQPGFDALQAGNLPAAVAFFSAIPADNDHYAAAQYYLGHASLQLKLYDDAIAAFETCIGSSDVRYREKAEWNKVLAYLAAGDGHFPEVKSGLEKIAGNPAHSYHRQAVSLQQQLHSFWHNIAKTQQ